MVREMREQLASSAAWSVAAGDDDRINNIGPLSADSGRLSRREGGGRWGGWLLRGGGSWVAAAASSVVVGDDVRPWLFY